MNLIIAGFGKNPVRFTGLPSLNKINVGMDITSNLCASSPSASTSTLTILTFKEGKVDPIIGRDDEIRRIIQILSRKTKNNPVLIGEPGVGKTAIVEGLA